MNMKRGDLRLRGDIDYILKSEGLADSLLYFDDLKLLPANTDKYVFLVDCNELNDDMKPIFAEDRVVGIIDHHVDEGRYISSIKMADGPRIIQKSGSCSSLVTNYWHSLFQSKLGVDIFTDQHIAKLASAPLLIDTSGMKKKVEESDTSASKVLSHLPEVSESSVKKPFLKNLQKLKKDISQLSAVDIIRKDFKKWGTLGISSTVKPLSWIYGRHNNFSQVIADFANESNLQVYAILCAAVVDDQFQREIAVWVKDEYWKQKIGKFFDLSQSSLELEPKSVPESDKIHPNTGSMLFFNQKNTLGTRKQVAPLMREALFDVNLGSL